MIYSRNRHDCPGRRRFKPLCRFSRTPFVDSAELAGILGEPHATVHRALAGLLAEGVEGRVSHGTAHLPSSQRYFITANGIREAAGILGFDTPSDFVRAYPMSGEWLTLLIRRMDTVAAVYRLPATISPGTDGLQTNVEFHRRGRFDATITLHDGRNFGVVRQGLALRRRFLYDRLRAIAEYDSTRRPDTVLILVPSVWEERLTTRFCDDRHIRDCYVAVESRDALEGEVFYTLLEVRVLTERYRQTYTTGSDRTALWATGRQRLRPSCLPTLSPCLSD